MPHREISVVVPSHGRRLRLRWLLNALEEQTLPSSQWELLVVHDYGEGEAEELFGRHPLAAAGVLRHTPIEPGTGSPARQRNLGWRQASASLVAFIDDDCRPEPDWLASLLRASERHPEAIIQGTTRPDPLETDIFAGPHTRSLHVDPPGPYFQTCNIAYPKEVLYALDGFDESFSRAGGEDTDLALRALAAGVRCEAEAGALVYHSVESYSLIGMIRLTRKWGDIPRLARLHPEIRQDYTLGVFWRPSHFHLALAAAGFALARRHPGALALTVPYIRAAVNARGRGKKARLASAAELPGKVVVDTTEVITLVVGSFRHRTVVL